MSVVIPYYRGEQTLPRALRSLESQTLRPAEVVVVDDGSPRPLLPGDVRSDLDVRVERHEWNRGIPAARNTGIRSARHDWIGFLDQDDEWLPGKLARQWPEAVGAGPDAPVVFGRCAFEGAGWPRPGLVLPRPGSVRRLTAGPERAARELMLGGNRAFLISVLLHRGALERSGYMDEDLVGGVDDYELMLRLAAEGVPFLCPDGRGADVVHHHTGENYSDPVKWAAEERRMMPALAERFPSIRALLDRGLARVDYRLGRYHHRQGERVAAGRRYREAVARDPYWWRPRAALALLRAQSLVKWL